MFRKIFNLIYWINPLLKLAVDTADAVSDGYDERNIKDPGHDLIKKLDKIVISITWILATVIIISSLIFYQKIYSVDYVLIFFILFFPYLANIYITIMLYINSIILSIYNKNRKFIIRKVNEKQGVW